MKNCLTCTFFARCGKTKDGWCPSHTTANTAHRNALKADAARYKQYGEGAKK